MYVRTERVCMRLHASQRPLTIQRDTNDFLDQLSGKEWYQSTNITKIGMEIRTHTENSEKVSGNISDTFKFDST